MPNSRVEWDVSTSIEFWQGGGRGFVVYFVYPVVDSLTGALLDTKSNRLTFLEKDIDNIQSFSDLVELVCEKLLITLSSYDEYYSNNTSYVRLSRYRGTNLSRNEKSIILNHIQYGPGWRKMAEIPANE